MKNKPDEYYQLKDFFPFTGLNRFTKRNNLQFDDKYGGFGNPNANLKASSKANFLAIYNLVFAGGLGLLGAISVDKGLELLIK